MTIIDILRNVFRWLMTAAILFLVINACITVRGWGDKMLGEVPAQEFVDLTVSLAFIAWFYSKISREEKKKEEQACPIHRKL